VDQEELKKMSMSELIAQYNVLASARGLAPQNEFKNLAAARTAITNLESKMDTQVETQALPVDGATPIGTTPSAAVATSTADPKYSTVGKRGPNQGVGEYAKQLLTGGMPTGEVLKKVLEQFPTAKTSASCIAYYKAALKNPNLGKRKAAADPAALRAKAAELMAAATAAEQAAVVAAQAAAEKAKAQAEAAQAAVAQADALAAAQAAAQQPTA